MSTLKDYTQEEIEKLMAAPLIISMYVMGSSLSGPVGLVREMMAGVEASIEAGKNAPAGSLFSELWSEQNLRVQQENMQRETKLSTEGAEDMAQAKAKMLEDVKGAVSILSAKGTPEEADQYRKLLAQVAAQVANAAKEGGFMGIGGEQVNQAEVRATDEIRAAVGLSK